MRWLVPLIAATVPLIAATVLLSGCGPSTPDGSRPAARDTGEAVTDTFTNPVYRTNFPDPGVLRVGDVYHAYGTNNATGNVPVLTSTDLVHWRERGDVLPQLGSWATGGRTWAPEVLETADKRYVLYYTALSTAAGRQCVGLAVADNPLGPFVDDSPQPLICEADEGGSIDASPFRDDDGAVYLFWKNDGNAIGQPTHLYGQRLSPDGRQLTGERVRLLTNDQPWQAHVIEAPQLHQRDGKYYLFYSANAFNKAEYAVGYAVCDTPLGPCRDAPENPIVSSAGSAAGPGHCSVVTGPDGGTWMLYHAWHPDAIGSADPGRTMWLDRVEWVDGKPVVRGPTSTPQPMPRR